MTMGGTTLLSADYKAPLIPEDSLPKLEMMLEDVPLKEKELKLLVDRFFRGTSAQGLGVSPEDFVKAILAAKPGETGS